MIGKDSLVLKLTPEQIENGVDDKILSEMTEEEKELLEKLKIVVKEASDAEKIINNSYKPEEMKVDKVTIWDDGYNRELFTNKGEWLAIYVNSMYSVKCSKDEIYKLFLAQFLYENEIFDSLHYKSEKTKAVIFKDFIAHTKLIK